MAEPSAPSDSPEQFSSKAPVAPLATAGAPNAADCAAPPSLQRNTASSSEPTRELSARALNVLKELTTRLTGETPPKGRWTPPEELLEKLTFKCLSTARNCGSQTIHEIILWASSKGVTVQPSYHAGKPLSAMWHDLAVRFAAGEFNQTELAQALEKSIRRRNTRIPLAFQEALLKVLNAGDAFHKPMRQASRQDRHPAG